MMMPTADHTTIVQSVNNCWIASLAYRRTGQFFSGGGKAGTFLPEKYCVSARKKLLIYPYTNTQLTETVYTVDK